MKKICLVAILLLASMSLAFADVLRIPYSFDSPQVTQIGNAHHMAIPGLRSTSAPGDPVLPVRTANVVIPYGKTVRRVSIRIQEDEILSGRYLIEYGRPVQPIGLPPASKDERNEKVYRSDDPYPRSPVRVVGEQMLRDRRILVVNLYPLQYTPTSGKVVLHRKLDLVVETVSSPSLNGRGRMKGLPRHPEVDNPSALNTYPAPMEVQATAQYLLITSADLLPGFQPLLDWKRLKGLTCEVVLVEDIDASFPGRDLQEKIRNCIRDFYLNRGTEYVLLGGDDDVVPARGALGEVGYYLDETMPADLYYAVLDGDWNSDGDEIFGEPTDGPNGGEVDLLAEVLVGRAPVGTPQEASHFVAKTLAYEQNGTPNLATMVWMGEQLDNMTLGSLSKEAVAQAMPEGYSHVRLYESDRTFTKQNILDALNSSPHTVNHLGHSSERYGLGLEVPDVEGLHNETPFFVYSQGCYAGAFDTAVSGAGDCIGEKIVTIAKGAFAGIFNSRFGWYAPAQVTTGPSHYFDYEFFDAVFIEGRHDPTLARLGAAHQDAKEDLIGRIDEAAMRWCYMNLNLFGDPETTLYNVLHKGTISLDAKKYQSTAVPVVRVSDYDLNVDHANPDSAAVTVSTDTQPEGLSVILGESAANSGSFAGTVLLSPDAKPGTLQATHGDMITTSYADHNDGSGAAATVTATALIDDMPPVVSDLRADAVRDSSALIVWETDELADGVVEYGPTPDLGFATAQEGYSTEHALRLTELSSDTDFYFAIRSTDEAGNAVRVQSSDTAFHTMLATRFFFDDIEPGGPAAKGLWHTEVVDGRIAPWDRSRADSFSRRYSWHADDFGSPSAVVLDTPEVDLSDVATPQLTFMHRMLSEKNYDGGFVEVSVDGGLFWHALAQSDMIQGTPYGQLGSTCPTPGASGWNGDIPWERVIFDLSDFAGRRVIIRFRMESDNAVDAGEGDGWYIDDVEISGIHGMIALDRPAYRPGDTVRVTVFGGRPNAARGKGNGVSLAVTSELEPRGEPVSALPPLYPRSFTGQIALDLGAPRPDGRLQVRGEDTITAEYADQRSIARMSAPVDGVFPRILNIRTVEATATSVTLAWETDEPTDARILYGLTPELGDAAYDARFTTEHVVTLTGLKRTSIYYFRLVCADRAGNITSDDNNGQLHTFVSGGFELEGTITEDMTLVAIPGHPWTAMGDVRIAAGATLTIEPGVVIKLGKGGRPLRNCSVFCQGSINALGTADKPIIFTSIRDDSAWGDTNGDGSATTPASGDWGTVYLSQGVDATRLMEHCIFRYGGWEGGQECGVIESRQPGAVVRNCRFEQNVFPVGAMLGMQPELTGPQMSGNDFNGVWLRPSLQGPSDVLSLTGVPYILWSSDGRDITFSPFCELTILPGVVVKMGSDDPDRKLSAIVRGSIKAIGTPDQPVVITSLNDDSVLGDTNNDGAASAPAPGDWGRFLFSGEGTRLENCVVRYGGWDDGAVCPALEFSGVSPELRYSEISACTLGLKLTGGVPLIENCTIALNAGDGLVFGPNTSPTVRNTISAFNGGWGVTASDPMAGLAYSDIYGNGLGDVRNLVPGDGCIRLDPAFMDVDLLDLRLSADSPCIDAGDPAGFDPGTDSRADMGAYPYADR